LLNELLVESDGKLAGVGRFSAVRLAAGRDSATVPSRSVANSKPARLDAKYRYHFADQRYYVEPHLRYYSQNAADFYHSYLQQGREINVSASGVQALVENASADSRLGAFDAVTYGIKFGMQLTKDRELTLRIEQYEQQAQDLKPMGGQLANQILQPDLSATWVQLGYQFKW